MIKATLHFIGIKSFYHNNMNPNIRFQTKHTEVSVFKIEEPLPSTIALVDKIISDKTVYCCKVGEQNIEVCEGDYIVIGQKSIYLNGECKLVESVEAMTEAMLHECVEAWDERDEEYVDIVESFMPEVMAEEPSDEELKKIEAQLANGILFPEEDEF